MRVKGTVIKRAVYASIGIGLAYFLAAALIAADGLHDRLAVSDVIVVPGNQVLPDGHPSPRLQARLDKALQLFRAGYGRSIFVSGGTGVEGYDEAAVMRRYLLAHGVADAAVVADPLGRDTKSTARNLAAYMHARDLHSALIVSQYFHLSRCRLLLEQQGVRVAGQAHADFAEFRDIYSLLREVAAYLRHRFRLPRT